MKHATDIRGAAALGSLNRAQKAAAILVAMGKPSAGRLLKFFKQEELKALIEAARLLQTISQSELERIVAEFEAEFTEGAGLLDSGDQMDNLLNEAFSPDEIDVLMGRGKAASQIDTQPTIWSKLETMEPERAGELLGAEHAQTIALILSQIKPQATARIMVTFSKSVRSEVIKRMLSLTKIQPQARKLVETQLQVLLNDQSGRKDQSAGQARVASILNELDKSLLDEVMDDLERNGGADVAALRARLFSFEDIVRLDQRSRVALFDGLSTELVTMALREADPKLQEAALSALGARSRRMIEAELAGPSDQNIDVIMRARREIASNALELAGQGLVELPSVDDIA